VRSAGRVLGQLSGLKAGYRVSQNTAGTTSIDFDGQP